MQMVHQLLAGVHICCAAEALALAAKAGLDVQQMYEIVIGAGGNSWMFEDRGKRMLMEAEPQVMSALNVFVKDLDIVHSEAKRLQSPVPIASAALQQFVSGQSLGYGFKDDSQVVKVYETITGASVSNSKGSKPKEGDNVGDFWVFEDGTTEEILEVAKEPRHHLVLCNAYTRVLRVQFMPNDTTLAHRHAEDSLYFFLVPRGLSVINHVKGSAPVCDCMEFGEVRFGTHKSDKPLVHKITNKSDDEMYCIDAEVLSSPPIVSTIPLDAEHHKLVKTRDKVRVYKLTLKPCESTVVTYKFFYLEVILSGSPIQKELGGSVQWTEEYKLGDFAWKEPCLNLKMTNMGTNEYVAYICEWR